MFVSAELILIGALAVRFPDVRVARQTDLTLQSSLPVITASRVPGAGAAVVSIDRPLMDVDVYAASWAAADALMGDVRAFMYLGLPGSRVDVGAAGVASVLDVVESSAPAQRPTADPGVFRCGGTWRLATKRVGAA